MKTTKVCHACGSHVSITAKFCLGCGSAVSKPSVAVSQPPTSSVTVESKQSPAQQVVTPSSGSVFSKHENSSDSEKFSNRLAIIVCAVIVVMAAIDYAIWVKSKSSETLDLGATSAQKQTAPTGVEQTQEATAVAVDNVEQTQTLPATNAGADKEWVRDDFVANGKTVYEKNCAVCHLASGAGMPPAFPALTGGKITTGPVADHIAIVLNGKNVMPTWKAALNDVEIASVITYVRNALGNTVGDFVQPAQVKAAR